MNEFFSRNWSLIIVVAVLFIALGLASRLDQVNMPGRELSITLVDILPFELGEGADGVQVSLDVDGVPAQEACLTVVWIRNTGNVPIEKDDYEEDIQFFPRNDAAIVKILYELMPEDINMELSYDSKRASLSPALLNPGDQVIMHVFTTGEPPDWGLDARVAGVRQLAGEDMGRDVAHGDQGLFIFGAVVCSLFNLVLASLFLRTDSQARYVVIGKRTAIVNFGFVALTTLMAYVSLVLNHGASFFTSQLVLAAFALLAVLGAWLAFRLPDRQ